MAFISYILIFQIFVASIFSREDFSQEIQADETFQSQINKNLSLIDQTKLNVSIDFHLLQLYLRKLEDLKMKSSILSSNILKDQEPEQIQCLINHQKQNFFDKNNQSALHLQSLHNNYYVQIQENINKKINRQSMNQLKLRNILLTQNQIISSESAIEIFKNFHLKSQDERAGRSGRQFSQNQNYKELIVSINTNCLLEVREKKDKNQEISKEQETIFQYDLKAQDLCSNGQNILALFVQNIQPQQNRKVNNFEKFNVCFFDKSGQFVNLVLNLTDYSKRQLNQSPRKQNNRRGNVKPESDKQQNISEQNNAPQGMQIRLEEIIRNNSLEQLEINELNPYWQANFIVNNGNHWLFAIDSLGFGYYFYTFNFRQFRFHSKFWLGGIPYNSIYSRLNLEQIHLNLSSSEQEQFQTHYQSKLYKFVPFNQIGFFLIFENGFAYQPYFQDEFKQQQQYCQQNQNMETNQENQIIDISIDKINQGTVYALTESGDQILIFYFDYKQGQYNKFQNDKNARHKRQYAKDSKQNMGICELIGSIQLNQINSEKIVELHYLKNHLLLVNQNKKIYDMEAKSIEQMINQPFVEELNINFILNSSNIDYRNIQIDIEKTQNDPNLLAIKALSNHSSSENKLVFLDINQIPLKYKLFHSQFQEEKMEYQLDSFANLGKYLQRIGSSNYNEDSESQQRMQSYHVSRLSEESDFQHLADVSASEKGDKKDKWKFVNYILGVVTFFLMAYLIKTSREVSQTSSRSSFGKSQPKNSSPFSKKSIFGGSRFNRGRR